MGGNSPWEIVRGGKCPDGKVPTGIVRSGRGGRLSGHVSPHAIKRGTKYLTHLNIF